jgi:hypothetical protein
MLYELGYEVTRLCRVRIGPLKISTMKPGEYRLLNAKEVADLKGDRPIPPTRAEQAQAARKRPPRASKP